MNAETQRCRGKIERMADALAGIDLSDERAVMRKLCDTGFNAGDVVAFSHLAVLEVDARTVWKPEGGAKS